MYFNMCKIMKDSALTLKFFLKYVILIDTHMQRNDKVNGYNINLKI